MRLLQRIAAAILVALPLLSAASCSDDQIEALVAALGEGCLIDSDCEGDLICVFRRCHIECETTKDCRDRGENTDCVFGNTSRVCLLPEEEDCVVEEVQTGGGVVVPRFLHSTCPSAQLLCARDGECRNGCELDDDCVGGASCTITGVCAGEEDAVDTGNAINESGEAGVETATCIYSSECISPLACQDNQCREACLADADCPDGQECMLVESPALGESFGACRSVNVDPELPPTCTNGMLDAGESDVDCGGPDCAACPSGSACGDASDCASGICDAGTCKVPSCTDGVQNANETDIDCGGPQCAPCGEGDGCYGESDCELALVCAPTTLTCVAATCSDGLKNGDETGIDCGGSCPSLCGNGMGCSSASSCESGVCVGGTCQPASCSDGVQNGSEAGVDCGSAASGCALCGNGASCTSGSECQSGSCQAMVCTAPSCTDGVQNGFELGVDCGGPACAAIAQGCALGTTCNADSDCDQTSPAGCSPSTMQCTAMHTVSVTLSGSGSGYVLSNPPGINCQTSSATNCQLAVYAGQSVTLTGYAQSGSSFAGLSGGCSGNPSCNITVSTMDVGVTATFP